MSERDSSGENDAARAAARQSATEADWAPDLGKRSYLPLWGDRSDPVLVFKFVKAHRDQYPVAAMCRVLGVSTAGYYAWLKRPPSRRTQENKELKVRIAAIHAASGKTFGASRVHAKLKAQSVKVSKGRVARLMRSMGLQGVSRAPAAE